MSQIKYRKARYEDIDDILSLYYELTRFHQQLEPEFFNNNNQSKTFVRNMMNDRDVLFYVATSLDNVVGFVLLQIDYSINLAMLKKYKYVYLTDLVVDSNFQKQGIANKSIDYAIEYCQDNHLDIIELTVWSKNKKAIELYEKRGFREKLLTMTLDTKKM